MNELDSLRQEAETLKNAIRVSITRVYSIILIYIQILIRKCVSTMVELINVRKVSVEIHICVPVYIIMIIKYYINYVLAKTSNTYNIQWIESKRPLNVYTGSISEISCAKETYL